MPAKIIGCLIGGMLLFLAGLSIYRGHITLGRHSHHDVYASHDPSLFWLYIAFYIGAGAYFIFRGLRG